MTAVLPSGHQTTQWVYGVTTGGGSAITSNDLLAEVDYPAPAAETSPTVSAGDPGGQSTDKETFRYNAAGDVPGMTDQNGTTFAAEFDALGRPTAPRVTAFGSGVDQAVKREET